MTDRYLTLEEQQVMHAALRNSCRQLRSDLTPEEKAKAEKIGRIEFTSAGARRQK